MQKDCPLVPFRVATLTRYGFEFFQEWLEFYRFNEFDSPDTIFCEQVLNIKPVIPKDYTKNRFIIGDFFEDNSIHVLCVKKTS